jgi:pseudouridine-5'-phosphate glycosidase
LIALGTEVAEAKARGAPLVALESSVIAQGLPRPHNLEVARELELAVREAGAVPATVAVLGGRACVGLSSPQLEQLAAGGARKAGAGELAFAIATGGDAATTVSATVVLAARAGIRVVATGGIGGVHPGDADDVSHDLYALARERVAVVASGGKSILDLPRTLERLESLGVPVVGFGTAELPAFYARSSGLPLELRVDDVAAAARLLRAHWEELDLPGGVLVAHPIPAAAALDPSELDRAVESARAEAGRMGVRGKALTPFLLAALARATEGRSIAANRALLGANARLAAGLAAALNSP